MLNVSRLASRVSPRFSLPLPAGLHPPPRVYPRQQPNRARHVRRQRRDTRGRRRAPLACGRCPARHGRGVRRLGHDAVNVPVPRSDGRRVEQLHRHRDCDRPRDRPVERRGRGRAERGWAPARGWGMVCSLGGVVCCIFIDVRMSAGWLVRCFLLLYRAVGLLVH